MRTMKVGAAIKEMIALRHTSQKALAEKLGYKTYSCLSAPIKKNEIKVSTLVKFADALGYDVVLVMRDTVDGYPNIKIEPNDVAEKEDT